MRDFASCFSEHAIKVSDSSCSGSNRVPSTQNIVSYLYKTKLSTQKELLIIVTWCKNLMGQGLSVNIGDDPSCICKVDTNSWPFTKKKGTRSFESGKSKINIFWDVSSARFESGPEPSDGFYVVVVIDSELGLLLGDMGEEEAIKKFHTNAQIANFYLVARKEHVFGKTLYSTKARFCDHGIDHDILIKCRGENGGLKDSELSISIDRRRVIHVKNLQWKFRGNQTLFIDGLPVDMMWDVHDWFFNSSASGYGVFMFRTRSGLESRLWLEEIMQQKEEKVGFSLLIYACKSP
ncbi:DUF868 domain-containing protein [Cinnamomum micranthum f. kanehirae]|uniref:DUF868 domain-containing protein n=1 Tax=Cinnamomum micranthum f. kanehirae TaxID=337451 RepID=A0A3S4NW15_9MAGN|nr:DUF868 domain-containing protein [Cinnamomum micranthum f. kanehirae]